MLRTRDGALFAPPKQVVQRVAALPFAELTDHEVKPLGSDANGIPLWLRAAFSDPVFEEGMHFASTEISSRFGRLLTEPGAKSTREIVDAAMRYALRARSRATPFGLFAGVGVLGVSCRAEPVVITIPSEWSFRVRPDYALLQSTIDAMRSFYDVQKAAMFRVPELARLQNGRLYVVREDANGIFTSVRVEMNEALTILMERATSSWVRRGDLELSFTAMGYSKGDIRVFLSDCLTCGVLESALSLSIVGEEPAKFAFQLLEKLPTSTALETQMQLQKRISLAVTPVDLTAVTSIRQLAADAAGKESKINLQCDAFVKTVAGEAPATLVNELFKAADAIRSMSRFTDPLHEFKERFRSRYEDAFVPLLEALDPDTGIGFGHVSKIPSLGNSELSRVLGHLSDSICHSIRNGFSGIEIDDQAVNRLSPRAARPFGSSFAVQAVPFEEAWYAQTQVSGPIAWLRSVIPAPAVAFLGRFTNDHSDLLALARRIADSDSAVLAPARAAEVVYLPKGRSGNVLWRGSLYDACIPINATRLPDDMEQISPRGLTIGLDGSKLVLWSPRLNCEVVPRVSNAHAFDRVSSLPLYRFLCMLQYQTEAGYMRFSWYELSSASFLPRVTYSKIVISAARWRLRVKEGVAASVERARSREGLPRHVLYEEGENLIAVDLEDPLQVRAVLKPSRSGVLILQELLPQVSDSAVRSPRGVHRAEFIVPFVRPGKRESALANSSIRTSRASTVTFRPGSEWTYVKIYAGSALHDLVLSQIVGPLVAQLSLEGVITQWFFIRYADPDPHIRLRFRRQIDDHSTFVSRLCEVLEARISEFGSIARIAYDTYVPEIARYGGLEGMEYAHGIFTADSQLALDLLSILGDEEVEGQRERLLGVSAIAFLEGFSLPLSLLRAICTTDDTTLRPEERAIANSRVRRLHAGDHSESHDGQAFSRGLAKEVESALAYRAARSAAAQQSIVALKLPVQTMVGIVASHLHMIVNRLVKLEDARMGELILLESCRRHFGKMAAISVYGRGGQKSSRSETA